MRYEIQSNNTKKIIIFVLMTEYESSEYLFMK